MSSQDGFSQQSTQDDGRSSIRRRGDLAHQNKPSQLQIRPTTKLPMITSSDNDPIRTSVDHAVLKRVVDQEARLAEQASLIKRLETKLDHALHTSTQMQKDMAGHMAELPSMMHKFSEQLRSMHVPMHEHMHFIRLL